MHGLGVYLTREGEEVTNAVQWALEAGYRLVDTAAIYRNEAGVGQAVRASGLERGDVFVTTKVWNNEQGYEGTIGALNASLGRLGFDFVDLYLIHWPNVDLMNGTWRAMEHLLAEGKTRAIGVSNFEPHHLDQLMTTATLPPSVNQVELHPNLSQTAVRRACAELGTLVQAWSPLKQGEVLVDPTITSIAADHGVTAAQVVIRWQVQHGIATIPKSVRQKRIIENGDVFGFVLDQSDMAAIDDLDRNDRIGPEPDVFGQRYVP